MFCGVGDARAHLTSSVSGFRGQNDDVWRCAKTGDSCDANVRKITCYIYIGILVVMICDASEIEICESLSSVIKWLYVCNLGICESK